MLNKGKRQTVKTAMPVSVTCNGNVKKPKDVTDSRNGPRYRSRLLLFVICFLLSALFCIPLSSDAKVTGNCANCHTMHNSQNGSAVVPEGPQPSLLNRAGCLGCHSSTSATTWQDSITKAPIVFNTSAPQYGASSDGGTTYQGLAGGNFYWVQTDDVKGHNVFASNPDTLTIAPGAFAPYASCGTNSCHANIDGTSSGNAGLGLDGRQGCTKCHLFTGTDGKPKLGGYHHKDDGTGTKYVDSQAKGWYRFLSGHQAASDKGVNGIEDSDWQKTTSATDHNEYLGNVYDKTVQIELLDKAGNQTTTAFCCGCHNSFHLQDATATGASPWERHPSDAVLPASGEYNAYTAYDPLVPVARPGGFNWTGNTPSGTVSPGTDIVMCLSCHRSHGSPYFKMLRWDYKGWPVSGGTNGCNVCHTSKN